MRPPRYYWLARRNMKVKARITEALLDGGSLTMLELHDRTGANFSCLVMCVWELTAMLDVDSNSNIPKPYWSAPDNSSPTFYFLTEVGARKARKLASV